MNSDEYERLKEAEKAHLKKVRALKSRLRDAQRQQGLADALRAMDTSALDDEFDAALRDVEPQNVTAEARFEMAMDAVDAAAERERQRLEQEQFELERQRQKAADLIEEMKRQMGGDTPAGASGDSAADASGDSERAEPAAEAAHQKTIGRQRPRTE
jgi:hypothetical protein